MAKPCYTPLSFAQLKGWADDDHQAALDVFRTTQDALGGDWSGVREPAADHGPRAFFEERFSPVLITDASAMLFTGYYEPAFTGSLVATGDYRYPAYGRPDDLKDGTPYLTRREIEGDGALAGRGLELVWFADPLDLFFLQVQGSGRVLLPDGGVVRLGFAAKNGRLYMSIGKTMIARGLLPEAAVSPQAIRDWCAAHPDAARDLLWCNESYVFFRRIDEVPADAGPLGALGRPVVAGRSIAVDPQLTPLGAPVWIEKAGKMPLQRLMVAQDTGGAIKGAQRADIFCGTGKAAGQIAGAIRDGGRMVTLLPHDLAGRLCGGLADA